LHGEKDDTDLEEESCKGDVKESCSWRRRGILISSSTKRTCSLTLRKKSESIFTGRGKEVERRVLGGFDSRSRCSRKLSLFPLEERKRREQRVLLAERREGKAEEGSKSFSLPVFVKKGGRKRGKEGARERARSHFVKFPQGKKRASTCFRQREGKDGGSRSAVEKRREEDTFCRPVAGGGEKTPLRKGGKTAASLKKGRGGGGTDILSVSSGRKRGKCAHRAPSTGERGAKAYGRRRLFAEYQRILPMR